MKQIFTLFITICSLVPIFGQQSVARQWNEQLLEAIRNDVSRPTVHSRNLFHVSAVMYDAWAVYDTKAKPFFLGNHVGDYDFLYDGVIANDTLNIEEARNEAISYAAYRLMKHRFANSPGRATTIPALDSLMAALGYDTSYTETDYSNGVPAALGNYIALSCMEFGFVDYADEAANYDHSDAFYAPVNDPLQPELPGSPGLADLNHWQPLAIEGNPPRRFLNPHWGKVTPFSLTEADLVKAQKDTNEYYLYHDPGAPPTLDSVTLTGLDDYFKWNFALVAVWSGHLDPTSGVMVDISPGSVGNLSSLPETEEEMRAFYNFLDGGVIDTGYTLNPVTGQPYEPQMVPMGDFGRVLAEFWADGPRSETPPGHWFTILNYVSDHPLLEKRFEGQGDIVDDLEWDVKSYLILGGAMHDVAVAVWGIKSYYDYVRPISAIRGMAALGQSSDSTKLSYHKGGLPLIEGHIEVVEEGDALAGDSSEHVGKIKLYAWRGPSALTGDDSNAGVDWILAENWWPYQQPSFITPPFAGYISGHSTFSRAAAEVMTLITGDPYFPGGMGIFDAPQNEYLVFEEGPSIDLELQWATYRDASDQASLSRLWGGIHPPVDDIPGRMLGKKIGPQAFDYALTFFEGETVSSRDWKRSELTAIRNFPNPVSEGTTFEYIVRESSSVRIKVFDISGRVVFELNEGHRAPGQYRTTSNDLANKLRPGTYFYRLESPRQISTTQKLMISSSR